MNRRGLAILLAALIGGYVWLSGGAAMLVPELAPARCTVGLNGAAVNITVEGPGAMARCQSALKTTTNGRTWFLYASDEQASGSLMCQVSYAGDLWDVRDSGLLDMYGNSICQDLLGLANG
jgi:hypothetical protein